MYTTRFAFVAAVLGTLLVAPRASADVIPPNFSNCNGKAAGEPCDLQNGGGTPTGVLGRCAPTTCYEKKAPWDGSTACPDGSYCHAGAGWEYTPVACLECLEADAATPTDGSAGSGGSQGAGGVAAATGGATVAQGVPTPSNDSSGCAAAGRVGHALGPWILAGSVWLLLIARRRRRPTTTPPPASR
jgi:hypothetical protein